MKRSYFLMVNKTQITSNRPKLSYSQQLLFGFVLSLFYSAFIKEKCVEFQSFHCLWDVILLRLELLSAWSYREMWCSVN